MSAAIDDRPRAKMADLNADNDNHRWGGVSNWLDWPILMELQRSPISDELIDYERDLL